MPRFTITCDGEIERSFAVDGDELLVGRLPSADIVLAGPAVSRQHAVIRKKGDSYVMEDKGSVNGLLVDGSELRTVVLEPGMKVEIDNYGIIFEPDEDTFEVGRIKAAQAGAGTRGYDMTMLGAAGFGLKPPKDEDDETQKS